ncbi:putative leucine-rich repeat-containing, plant-type, leucine-rich repeat domain, L [Medicago truncatula]|nr:putative leucine-rich repeat-containing, plant-type, leucine-rich repeat domain, L [Medicago truncatula]
MMAILTTQMSLLFLLLLSITTFHITMCSNHTLVRCNENHTLVRCNEKDRETLLTFKQGINDSFGMISTWSTEKDCCSWEGVHCDNITGRVIEIDLKGEPFDGVHDPVKVLKGEMNFCILELEFLSYLDLSFNEFDVISIPSIQNNITHSSNLFYLDLHPPTFTLHMDNLDWLSPHSSLKYLNLSWIDLHKETNWLQIVNSLPSLLELELSGCNLNNFPSVEYLNLPSLVTLSLSFNNFTSHIPDGFFNLTKDLTSLDLSYSNIHGEIPSSLLNLQNLRQLHLSNNQLQGSIPSTLGNLSSLISLSIGSNNFSGEISQFFFSKLSSLNHLDLSNSNFEFQFDLDWVPPFQLHTLSLNNITQGPNFPSWIYTQKSLQNLDISSAGISLVDRYKFSSLIERISFYIVLSNNSIAEDISNLTLNCSVLRLDHNNFTGGLPNLSPKPAIVDLSYNSFSRSIPHSWKNLSELRVMNLWNNKLSGELPLYISNWKELQDMNLGKNEFSGNIPVGMSQNLRVVILRANKFEGIIPRQLFNLSYLFHLDLAHNKLSGSLPHFVYNLTQMDTDHVDLWYDTTIDLFTKGQYYVCDVNPDRRTIDLSANHLTGEVPLELFRLVQVQSLNLSHNSFKGTIPKTIGGMKKMESLDLSNNKFFGEIPQSMALLNFLGVLNLSCNNFDGKIPTGTQLQSRDASSYIGNPKLCGAPLNNCTITEENPKTAMPSTENEDDESIKESLYLGMGVGFAAGFWGICGSLFLIRKWRHAYFRFIYGVGNRLYVTLMVKLNSFRRS